jgi:hypothetical protein
VGRLRFGLTGFLDFIGAFWHCRILRELRRTQQKSSVASALAGLGSVVDDGIGNEGIVA